MSSPIDRIVSGLHATDRVFVVVAHPDDEVIGCGGRLPVWGARVTVIHVTNGAPADGTDAQRAGFPGREAYAAARRQEAVEALRIAGLAPSHLISLGYGDQEGAAQIAPIARDLARLVAGERPTLVVTQPYEGGHPDHDAVACAVAAARALVIRAGPRAALDLIECTAYHAGPDGIETGSFLEEVPIGPGRLAPAPASRRVALDDDAQGLKRAMIACFTSQRAALAPFGTACERYRTAPAYCFAEPPHPGRLFYEHFTWGVRDGGTWRRLARAALEQLDLPIRP
jgi:LmbE family N-acetylglucosaminyl deacetylase